MEMEGLNDHQVEKILQLMEICSLEFDKAKELLKRTDFNVESATQLVFNPGQVAPQQPVMQPVVHPYEEMNNNQNYYEDQYDENEDPGFTRYKNNKIAGISFEEKHPQRSKKGILGRFLGIFSKEMQPGEVFIQKLAQTYPGLNKINFNKTTFLEALYEVKSTRYPLAVFLYDFSPNTNEFMKRFISNNAMAEFLNVSLRVIGFDTSSYQVEPELAEYLDVKKVPCMMVFKVDECNQIIPMDTVQLTPETDLKQLKQRLNKSKSQYIKDEIRENQYLRRYNNELNGIFDSNPMTFERRLELQQERRLMKQQEAELQSVNEEIEVKKKQQQLIKKKEQQKLKESQKILSDRVTKRANFQLHNNGVKLRLRLPNGEQLVLTVPPEQKVEYLFEYVESLEDCGFEENVYRKFDIIRPYDKLTLADKRTNTLQEAFGETDSENLVVTEQ